MDVEPEVVLEDGEISDDSVDYTPLERPLNSVCNISLKAQEKNSDNDSNWSNDTDSDSDDSTCPAKKQKIPVKSCRKPPVRRKKYDIWSSHVQEDVLAETLTTCDVSRIDRSRNIESYNSFDLRRKLSEPRQRNKRKYFARKTQNVTLVGRDDSGDDDIKGSARDILDLATNSDNTDEEVAKDIANKLCEEKEDLMLRIVEVIGKKKSIELFNDTKRIESDGGMLIMNRTRRRTPGGVFIFLLKRDDDVSDEQQKQIFQEDKRGQLRERKTHQKAKLKAIKDEIVAKKATNNKVPALLCRAELAMHKLTECNRERNESESEEFVNNPPPSPVTDGKENSNDGMGEETPPPVDTADRNLNTYMDDFLVLDTAADMDLF